MTRHATARRAAQIAAAISDIASRGDTHVEAVGDAVIRIFVDGVSEMSTVFARAAD